MHLEEGRIPIFVVEVDVVHEGMVVIPRGSAVQASIARQAGYVVRGRAGKYKVSFRSVLVRGRDYALKGSHIEKAPGDTTGKLLRLFMMARPSAVLSPGHLVNAFTAERIPYEV